MVRSLWIGAMVVGLAVIGLAWSQTSSQVQPGSAAAPTGPQANASVGLPRERFLTVQEAGKGPQRCKLLKSWRNSNGSTAYQVQAVATGEIMTLTEDPRPQGTSGTGSRTLATHIFHWKNNVPPREVPAPPPTATVLGTPIQQGSPYAANTVKVPVSPTAPAPSPVFWSQSGPPKGQTIPPSSPTLPTVVTGSPTSSQQQAASASKVSFSPSPGPMASIPRAAQPQGRPNTAPNTSVVWSQPAPQNAKPTAPASPALPTIVPGPATTAQLPAGAQAMPPRMNTSSAPVAQGVPIPPCPCGCLSTPETSPCRPAPMSGTTVLNPGNKSTPCACCCTPEPRQTLLGRIFKSNPQNEVVVSRTVPSGKPMPPVVQQPVQVAQANNQPAPAPQANKPAVAAKIEPAQPRDWRESWGKVEPWQTKAPAKTAASSSRTVAQVDAPRQADPLKDPDWYRNMALSDATKKSPLVKTPAAKGPVLAEIKPLTVSNAPAEPVQAQQVIAPAVPLVSAPRPRKVDQPPVQTPTVAAMAGMMGLPATQPNSPKVTTPAVPPTPAPVVVAQPAIQAVPVCAPSVPGQTVTGMASRPRFPRQSLAWGPRFGQAPAAVPEAPPGMASVMAAGVGAIELPANENNAFAEAPPPAPATPEYHAWNTQDEAAARRTGRVMPPVQIPHPPLPAAGPAMSVAMDSGVPTGMANAFTEGGTRRPIPADFGPPPQVANAFAASPIPVIAMGSSGPPRSGYPGYPAAGMTPYPGAAMTPGYGPVAMNPYMAVPAAPSVPAAMAVASDQPGANIQQLVVALKDSLYPSARETAADQLAEVNWRLQPQVVHSLMKVAQEDPAATVRAACVRALGHMGANTVDVVQVVQSLKKDNDPRVRHEAEETLVNLGIAATPRADTGIQTTSAEEKKGGEQK
jgi:hypothetical protein